VEAAPEEKFRIFVSHKHEDHELAMTVRAALQRLGDGKIECFVSGVDISAGADWNRQIKARLAQSHLLVLLFTSPSQNWDWCLYEAGLFTRFDVEDVSAIVCLFNPETGSPRPLANLQGVAAQPVAVERFLEELCRETWCISDDWRRGALDADVEDELVSSAAAEIVNAFPKARLVERSHYACHRVVLDLQGVDQIGSIIPESARVVEGEGATSGFTLSLFNRADGRRTLTWRDLVEAVDGVDAAWRHQLDRRFVAALNEELFRPISATLRAWNQGRRHQRIFKPVLYRILRAPVADGRDERGRPIQLTIVFDPLLEATAMGTSAFNLVRVNARFKVEVFDEFGRMVHSRAADGVDVFADIREAVRVVYEDADRFGLFEERELRRVYGEAYEREHIAAMGEEWEARLERLDAACGGRDADAVETELARLADLNRVFSILSTERYLNLLQVADPTLT
jgi:TIR domain